MLGSSCAVLRASNPKTNDPGDRLPRLRHWRLAFLEAGFEVIVSVIDSSDIIRMQGRRHHAPHVSASRRLTSQPEKIPAAASGALPSSLWTRREGQTGVDEERAERHPCRGKDAISFSINALRQMCFLYVCRTVLIEGPDEPSLLDWVKELPRVTWKRSAQSWKVGEMMHRTATVMRRKHSQRVLGANCVETFTAVRLFGPGVDFLR